MTTDLHARAAGEGPPLLLIHGTGTGSGVFAAAQDRLGAAATVIACDRRGWGSSPAPEGYRRTSIAEQAIEVGAALRAALPEGGGEATIAGIGLGAVVALEMALAEPERVAAVQMIEPPVFGGLPAATEAMSADVAALREAAADGGEAAAYELFLSGRLPVLGAGVERFADHADRGASAARAFLVELPAVPAWPLDPVRLARLRAEVTVVTAADTPGILIEAAESIAPRIPGARRERTAGRPELAPAELFAV